MLGQFWYGRAPSSDNVVLVLAWADGERRGKVVAPCWIEGHSFASSLLMQPSDELIGLPFALSYGVLIAASAGANLTVTGDASVWPEEWGILAEEPRHRTAVRAVKSH